MRRVIVIAAAGFSLAGCSSFSMGDYFKSTPPTVLVQLDSTPPGADARTSLGPGCKTPCSVTVPIPADTTGFSVTYSLNKFLPATVPVSVTKVPGDLTTATTVNVDPNPVVAQLQPAGPPPRAKRVMRPKKPRPPKDGAAPSPADSAFPAPATAAPVPPPPTTR